MIHIDILERLVHVQVHNVEIKEHSLDFMWNLHILLLNTRAWSSLPELENPTSLELFFKPEPEKNSILSNS